MALIKSSQVPKDAVVLSEEDAVGYVWNLITEWQPASDTWALRYSVGVLGGLNSITGLIINNHYRRKLKLGTYGHMSSLVPITMMPGLLTALFHRHLVSTDMLLMKTETCPICYELRSAVVQLGFGIAYPMVLAPTSAFMFANRYNTFRVPSLTAAPKDLFKFLAKITKPLSGTLTFLMTAQVVASSVLTYFELRNHLTVRQKILEIEKNYDENFSK